MADLRKPETEVKKTQRPATGARNPDHSYNVEDEAKQILTPTSTRRTKRGAGA